RPRCQVRLVHRPARAPGLRVVAAVSRAGALRRASGGGGGDAVNAALTVAGWTDLAATTIVAGGLAWAAVVAPPGAQGLRAVRSAMVVLAAVLAVEFALV